MSPFVTTEELAEFTGCRTQDAQRLVLKRRKIKYVENLKGVALTIAEYNRTNEENWPNQVLPSVKEIGGLPPMPRRMVGIYFLCKGKEVVYVGKTTNFYGRIGSHVDGKYDFDSIRFLPVHIKNLDVMEREYIVRFAPQYNITHKPIYTTEPNRYAAFD